MESCWEIWSKIAVGASALSASCIESCKAYKSPEGWCLYSFACVFFFSASRRMCLWWVMGRWKSDVQRHCCLLAVSVHLSAVLSVKSWPDMLGIVECISVARFSKKKIIVQELTFFASGEKWILCIVVAPIWIMTCRIWILGRCQLQWTLERGWVSKSNGFSVCHDCTHCVRIWGEGWKFPCCICQWYCQILDVQPVVTKQRTQAETENRMKMLNSTLLSAQPPPDKQL